MREVMLGKDKEIGAATRSCAIGTQWDQKRIAQAGYADPEDDKCRLCNAEIGDAFHRNRPGGCTVMARLASNGLTNEACQLWEETKDKILVEKG